MREIYSTIGLALLAMAMPAGAAAQGTLADAMPQIVAAIDSNSLVLSAARAMASEQRAAASADATLGDLDVELGFLWASADIPRTNIAVSQSFDPGILSGRKRSLAKQRQALADGNYRMARAETLLDAQSMAIEIVYLNALLTDARERAANAATVHRAMAEALASGQGNAVECNRAAAELAAANAEVAKLETERTLLLEQLATANGGKALELTANAFGSTELPTTYDEWATAHPALLPEAEMATAERAVAQSELSLTRSQAWPTLSAGYISEKTVSEHYQGFTVGVSVPLWSASRSVRRAKEAVTAAEQSEAATHQRAEATQRQLFATAKALEAQARALWQSIEQTDNRPLLTKALEAGRIRLTDYIAALDLYYDMRRQALEAERDSHRAAAQLKAPIL